jgi:hypothetical protein
MEPKDGADYKMIYEKGMYREVGAYYVTHNLPSEFVYSAAV